MRKVIGIGETILDIIFRNNQPERAVPGGSVFNCMVSLARCGIPAYFMCELGNDKVGKIIKDFMIENNLSPKYIDFLEGRSGHSFAFLDEQQDASYQFFGGVYGDLFPTILPEIQADDILIIGSLFAVELYNEKKFARLLRYAQKQKAIIYYDINFRKAHAEDRYKFSPNFIRNYKLSTILRCSAEDLEVMYPHKTATETYRKYIAHHCPLFIVTQGEKEILLMTETFEKSYPVEPFVPVSTIGAGDSFNAGIIYGLMLENILLEDIKDLPEYQWDKLIEYGKRFAATVCMSIENYVGENFIP